MCIMRIKQGQTGENRTCITEPNSHRGTLAEWMSEMPTFVIEFHFALHVVMCVNMSSSAYVATAIYFSHCGGI